MATPGDYAGGSPYPDFARRRSEGAVLAEAVEDTPSGPRQWFGAYTWEAVRGALSDDALSARSYHDAMGLNRRYGEILPGMDPPAHRLHRAILQPMFSRTAVAGSMQPVVEAVVDELVDELAPGGGADLLSGLCGPMPALVLSRLFGLSDEWSEALRGQAVVLTSPDPEPAVTIADRLLRDLLPVIRQRRSEAPAQDLISLLVHANLGGRALTDLEVFGHLRVLAIAGSDTVTRATATTLFALLTHPDQLSAVRQDPRLAALAVDEAIRWECPALSVPRVAARDTVIGAVEIPAGAAVLVHLGSANHDPLRWEDPERYDLFRPPQPHAGFGMGAHACLGVHLANLIIEHAVTTVVDRLPSVRLDPQAPSPSMVGANLRAPTNLVVRWS